MIAYIALVLSIINSILWVALAFGIRKVFRKMIPMFQMMGIAPTQNLQNPPVFDIIGEADELANAETEKQ